MVNTTRKNVVSQANGKGSVSRRGTTRSEPSARAAEPIAQRKSGGHSSLLAHDSVGFVAPINSCWR